MRIPKPNREACTDYQWKYISLVPENDDILGELQQQLMDTIDLVTSLDDDTLSSAYAPGKWTILDILQHLIDCERIFAYRALCFARGDQSPLPGFDENSYAANARANNRKILNMVKELSILRADTLELFQSFEPAMWEQRGQANGIASSANIIAWMLCGHEIHHRNIIEERYIGR